MAEIVNIFDEDLRQIGTAPRSEAHRLGLIHDVAHCWVVDPRGEGRIFFQQRSMCKSAFPGFFDIAVGGHIDAGETPLQAVMREMREEIGLTPPAERFIFAGSVRKADYIAEGLDREIGRVFLLLEPEPRFAPGEEVQRMVWISLPEFLRRFEVPAVTAHDMDGGTLEIRLDQWAGSSSREFEDYVLPKCGLR